MMVVKPLFTGSKFVVFYIRDIFGGIAGYKTIKRKVSYKKPKITRTSGKKVTKKSVRRKPVAKRTATKKRNTARRRTICNVLNVCA
jgi:hypothetical protein